MSPWVEGIKPRPRGNEIPCRLESASGSGGLPHQRLQQGDKPAGSLAFPAALVGVNLDVKRRNRKRQRENGQPGGAGHRLRRPPGQRHQQVALLNNKGRAQHRGGFHRHLPRIALSLQLTVQHPLPLIPRGHHQMTGRKVGVRGSAPSGWPRLMTTYSSRSQLISSRSGWAGSSGVLNPRAGVDLARQQLGQRRAVGQITELKPQPGRLTLQVVHQRRKDAERGEIGDRNLHAVGAGGRHKRRRRRQLPG